MTNIRRNLNYIVIAVGIVMIWRGIWGLLDTYLTPSNPTLSFIISIIIGLIILLLNNPKKADISELL